MIRALVLACLVAAAAAQFTVIDATTMPSASSSVATMTPVHMIEPVYDNSRPAAGAAGTLEAPCTGLCGGDRPPVGTNVVIDDDVTAAPQWNSSAAQNGKFITFDSLSQTDAKANGIRRLSGNALLWKFGNATLKVQTKVRTLKATLRKIAARVDHHAPQVKKRLANATSTLARLTARVSKLEGLISMATSRGKLTDKQANRFVQALQRVRANIDRCQKAIDFINANAKKFETNLAAKQGPTAAREIVIKTQLVGIAKRLDQLVNITRKAAASVDKSKKGMKRVVNILRKLKHSIKGDLARESQKVRHSLKKGIINAAQAAKDNAAIAAIQATLDRIKPAVRIILSGAAKKKAARQAAKASAPVGAIVGGKKVAVVGGKRVLIKAVKKEVLKAETIGLAKQVDDLVNITLRAARSVDKNKTGVTALGKVIRDKVADIRRQLAAESAKVNRTLAKGQINPRRQQKERAALRLLSQKLAKIERALKVIEEDKKVAKRGRSPKSVLQRQVIKAAGTIDSARKQLRALKTQRGSPRFLERVGLEEAKLMSVAKKLDRFKKALAASRLKPAVKAALAKAIRTMDGHLIDLAKQVAALKAQIRRK